VRNSSAKDLKLKKELIGGELPNFILFFAFFLAFLRTKSVKNTILPS